MKKLSGQATSEEYIHNVFSLEYFLLALHPFVDGNGRAIRLFSDMLLQKRGILPSINLNDEIDFHLQLSQYIEHRKKGIRFYNKLLNELLN